MKSNKSILYITLLIFIIIFALEIVSANPAGLWKLDCSYSDASGNNNNGNNRETNFVQGKFGASAQFDSGDYISIPDSNSLDLKEFTTSAWFKIDSVPSASETIISKGTLNNYAMFIDSTSLSCYFEQNGLLENYNDLYLIHKTDISSLIRKWTQITCAFNQNSDRWEMYINGNKVNTYMLFNNAGYLTDLTTIKYSSPSLNSEPLYIGTNEGSRYFFKGIIDEVAIYNQALSDSEILNNYNNEILAIVSHKGTCDLDNDNDNHWNWEDCDDNNNLIWNILKGYTDSDKDTFGTGSQINICSGNNLPIGFSVKGGDCNDFDFSINPNALEICDNKDNNCNGQVDENNVCGNNNPIDNDNDGFPVSIDCNDNDNTIYPNAPEICDNKDNQCFGDTGFGQIDENNVCGNNQTCSCDNDCPADYFTSPFCQGNNLVKTFHNFSCISGKCIDNQTINLISICAYGCSNNACINQTDTIPPASVTELKVLNKSTSWIEWTWKNPLDSDFFKNIIFINGINVINTTNNYYKALQLKENTEYTITIHTIDTFGNINNTPVSSTGKTLLNKNNNDNKEEDENEDKKPEYLQELNIMPKKIQAAEIINLTASVLNEPKQTSKAEFKWELILVLVAIAIIIILMALIYFLRN